MALELIVNVLLFLGSGFCFWYVGSTMPKSSDAELGAEQWPQALLFLLMIAIIFNIYQYFKKHKKEEIARAFGDFLPGIGQFVKSKLCIGMAILVVMALVYESLGFLSTCLLFLVSYGVLLGERRPIRLAVSSVATTLILYVGFSVFLGIMLPRGDIGFLRTVALALESVFQR
jgi:hypothetical protein